MGRRAFARRPRPLLAYPSAPRVVWRRGLGQVPDLDLARRLRRRARAERREPARDRRHAAARVGVRDALVAGPARPGGRRGTGLTATSSSAASDGVGAVHHGAPDVRRRRGRVGRVLDGLVGRGTAVPRAGVRAHAPPARAARAGRAGRRSRSSPTAPRRRSSRRATAAGERRRRVAGGAQRDPAVPRRRPAR